MIPRWSSFGNAHAISWNLQTIYRSAHSPSSNVKILPHLESVVILAAGCSSVTFCGLLKSKSQSSSWVSLEKSASTAPALVPVARKGELAPGDHVKAAVRGISRSLTMLGDGKWVEWWGRRWGTDENCRSIMQTLCLAARSPKMPLKVSRGLDKGRLCLVDLNAY